MDAKLARGFMLTVIAVILAGPAVAATPLPVDDALKTCLKKADDLPDIAEAEAEAWFKKGGGDRARLCSAFAQFHRGEFLSSGGQFAALAAAQDKGDRERAASLHSQAGLAYMRADDDKSAEVQYAAALKLEPDDPEFWIDRATERAGNERYWDAIDDLNRALQIMPDMAEALRLRGDAWAKLGLESKAATDFACAEQVDEEDRTLGAHPAGNKQ